MKSKIVLTAVFLVLTICVFAKVSEKEAILALDTPKKPVSKAEGWTIFQVGVSSTFPESALDSNVYGLKLGAPVSAGIGKVAGVEFSLLASTTNDVYGVQFAPFANVSDETDGVQMCIVTNATDYFAGIQISMINVSGIANGFQMGLVNVGSKKAAGVQTGFLNYAQEADALQLGLINISNKHGFQLGFINVMNNGWLPFFPIINFSF